MTTLADVLDTPPLARRWAELIDTYAHDPRLDYEVWPLAVAARLHADIAVALRAVELLAQVDARHQPHRWSEHSDTIVCTAGCGAWPCDEARLLHPQLADPR